MPLLHSFEHFLSQRGPLSRQRAASKVVIVSIRRDGKAVFASDFKRASWFCRIFFLFFFFFCRYTIHVTIIPDYKLWRKAINKILKIFKWRKRKIVILFNYENVNQKRVVQKGCCHCWFFFFKSKNYVKGLKDVRVFEDWWWILIYWQQHFVTTRFEIMSRRSEVDCKDRQFFFLSRRRRVGRQEVVIGRVTISIDFNFFFSRFRCAGSPTGSWRSTRRGWPARGSRPACKREAWRRARCWASCCPTFPSSPWPRWAPSKPV